MRSVIHLGAAAALIMLALPATVRAQGLYLPGGGAAHVSMGGVSTATPVDAIGALYWNPAAIGRLGRSEAEIGGAFLFPNFYLDSAAPGLFGPRSGRTKSDSGVSVTSNVGVVYQLDDNSPWTLGLGLNTLGGGAINFPGDVGNPLLAGIGPLGNVQGPIASTMVLVQLGPTVAYRATDRLVLGVGPTVDVALTSFDPAFFGAPDRGPDGIGTFPTASHSRPFWGGGVRAGLVYSVTDRLDVGFGYTSPQWFETWTYHARTNLGLPRTLTLNATLPAIYSWGAGYRATDRLLLGVDLRYLDYANTDLFGQRVVDGGLGWQSVFAAAVGGRYQVTDRAALSAGYVYNDNPIPGVATLFNTQAMLITQHTVTVGATVAVTDAAAVSLGYAYGFENSVTGPVREATGTGVQLTSNVHLLTFALQFKFGGCGCQRRSATPANCDCPTVRCPDPVPAAAGPADPSGAATLLNTRTGG